MAASNFLNTDDVVLKVTFNSLTAALSVLVSAVSEWNHNKSKITCVMNSQILRVVIARAWKQPISIRVKDCFLH